MSFDTLVIQEYPEILQSGQITHKQIANIIAKYGTSYPTHISNPYNRLARGVYKFNIQDKINPENTIIKIDETEEELENRIADRYESMEILIDSVAKNTIKSLIIAGGAGLGKSYTVNKILQNHSDNYIFHRGYLKATHLFRLLYENQIAGQTIVLDDTDSIFSDETALNLLKAALELKPSRLIGWGSEKQFSTDDGENIPRYFQYSGSIIFLTNLSFSDIANGSSKYATHLKALESRSLVLDLNIKTKQEYMARIKLTVREGMLKNMGLNSFDEHEILDYIENNIESMKELSLRVVEKIAMLYISDYKKWRKLCDAVCLK